MKDESLHTDEKEALAIHFASGTKAETYSIIKQNG